MKYQIMIRKKGIWRRVIIGEVASFNDDDPRILEFLKDISKHFERRFKHRAATRARSYS
jgi:hypothetical protein